MRLGLHGEAVFTLRTTITAVDAVGCHQWTTDKVLAVAVQQLRPFSHIFSSSDLDSKLEFSDLDSKLEQQPGAVIIPMVQYDALFVGPS